MPCDRQTQGSKLRLRWCRRGVLWMVQALKQLPARGMMALILGYRYCISPLFPPTCRFVPSCSQYALDALRKYGVLRGTLLTLWRLLRCHPFSRGGYDPVK